MHISVISFIETYYICNKYVFLNSESEMFPESTNASVTSDTHMEITEHDLET